MTTIAVLAATLVAQACFRSGFGDRDGAPPGERDGGGEGVDDLPARDSDLALPKKDGPQQDGPVGAPSPTFSTIEGSGPVPADGVSAITVTVTLRDVTNRPVAGVRPTFSASGSGNVIEQSCSPTDPLGVSTCERSLRSTVREQKRLSILAPVSKEGGTVEFVTVPIFRSVGPGNTAPLASGNGLLVVDSVATFPDPVVAQIGVGDVLQYSTDGDPSFDAIAFVYERISSTVFSVRDAEGLAAIPATTPGQWAVFRAYTRAYDAFQGSENSGIDAALRDFDSWSSGKDLVAAQRSWHVACYADAPDTTTARIGTEWSTGPDTYIRLFTPSRPNEVGVTQRHQGGWTNKAYQLHRTASGDYSYALISFQPFVRIDGLQVRVSGRANLETGGITITGPLTPSSDVRISNNIVVGDLGAPLSDGGGAAIWIAADAGVTRIWNNVATDWYGSGKWTGISGGGFKSCIANNTSYGNYNGFTGSDEGSIIFKNNIAIGNQRGYYWQLDPSSSHNAATDGTMPGSNPITLPSDNPTDYFYGAVDFRPNAKAPFVSKIVDVGLDLSSDPCVPVIDDITGAPRPKGAYDLGAAELPKP